MLFGKQKGGTTTTSCIMNADQIWGKGESLHVKEGKGLNLIPALGARFAKKNKKNVQKCNYAVNDTKKKEKTKKRGNCVFF